MFDNPSLTLRRVLTSLLLAAAMLIALPARADPPGRIGRVAWISGDVRLSNTDSGETLAAPLNQPLTNADRLETGERSRTEIQIGSTTIRVDANTRMEFVRVDDDQIRVFLDAGHAIVKLTAADNLREFEMETRSGRFTPTETGIYRFDADTDGSTATSYFGRLRFESGNRAGEVDAGQSARFWNSGQTSYRLSQAIGDEFTQWSAARDQRTQAGTYSRYVSPEMTGAQDLDAYGDWSQNVDYGAVWYPRSVAFGWAPYRTGHWAWISPWGWTWVDDAPWGFAPFHYGRWVFLHGRWGWVPGTRIARPVYAPALVAWIGNGGISVTVSIGKTPSVGWFPLAPREIYVPAYRSSERYVQRVNVTHVQRITNVTHIVSNPQAFVQQAHYANRHITHAVTAVPSEVITHRRAVAPAYSPRTEESERRERPRYEPSASTPRTVPRTNRTTQEAQVIRREREQPGPATATPSPVRETREVIPSREPRRIERPAYEESRPISPTRTERVEPRRQESRPQREFTPETQKAHEFRRESARESVRPSESRPERSAPRQEERSRAEPKEERKHRRDDNERR